MKKGILILVLGLLLSSCQSKVIRYTSADVSDYNLQTTKSSKAKMISVKKVNKDTVWTFQESFDRGLQWQTIDHHTMDSASFYETNVLMNNYQTIVMDHYLSSYEELCKFFNISYRFMDGYKSEIIFLKDFKNRDELKQGYTLLMDFQSGVIEENAQYSDKTLNYPLHVKFTNGKEVISISDVKNFEEIDTPHLLNSVIYQNYDALVDYSKQEIASCKNDLDQIYIRANDEDSWTALDVYTYAKQYQIASTVLYDILQEKNLEDITVEATRDSYTVSSKDTEYGHFEHCMIPFYIAQKITDMQFSTHVNETTMD